jgi:hypothetical protein
LRLVRSFSTKLKRTSAGRDRASSITLSVVVAILILQYRTI